MAKRDPEKTARNIKIAKLSKKLKEMLPQVLEETGARNEHSLHAYFATRKAQYIDLKHEVIPSAEHYLSLFLKGLKNDLLDEGDTNYGFFYQSLFNSEIAKKYLAIFFQRTFLREYENLSKKRPHANTAAIWMGQNNADFGLFVTPRFRRGAWGNDNSEIRRVDYRYWSIGHVVQTGLVIPHKNEKMEFNSVDEYLKFFENVLVRHSASPHQKAIAELYSEYVRSSDDPENILLLLPELRFEGTDKKHKYRLDFCVIDVESDNRIGFEISPWSTHGKLTGTKGKKQKEINEEAAANFDKEMKKHKDYFRKFGIFSLIYTDCDLENIEEIFEEIQKYIEPQNIASQLEFQMLSEFME